MHESKCKGIIASLDVESLFTNVPIDATIEIILEQTYNNLSLSPPKIPKEILRQLLELCTKEAPFMCPQGNLYVQTEGVAMGSPLGPTFANFYMGDLENRVFKTVTDKPNIYGRYVDDIFVQVEDLSQLTQLRDVFQSHSVLNFTYEVSASGSLPFLDVLVKNDSDKFVTQIYHKPTDHGHCLNGLSECTDKYKISVINNYLNRAYKLTETWQDFHTEILHIKQRLINNNYTNKLVDEQIKKFLEQKQNCRHQNQKKPISVYYASQTHKNYKIEERIIKSIIHDNTECIDKNNRLQLIFYYRNRKTCNLVMRNKPLASGDDMGQTNVIYKFTCPMSHSQATEYIGLTQNTLAQRLTFHRQNGSILDHFKTYHNMKPNRDHLTQNTKVIEKASDRQRLAIKEALLILSEKPLINKQFDNFANILKLHQSKNDILNTKALHSTSGQLNPNLPNQEHLAESPTKINKASTQNVNDVITNQNNDEYKTSNEPDLPYSLQCDEEMSDTIPDMENVLRKFGVNPDNLQVVDINDYRWYEFKINETLSQSDTLSISQRISTLVRRTRYTHTYSVAGKN